jgi:hypothetical protein
MDLLLNPSERASGGARLPSRTTAAEEAAETAGMAQKLYECITRYFGASERRRA